MPSGTSSNKRAGTASGKPRTRSAQRSAPPPPRRSSGAGTGVAAALLFFVGLFSILGFFQVDAVFIRVFGGLVKGLIGYGYYLFPAALIAAAVLLARDLKHPRGIQAAFLVLSCVVLGALVHVLAAGHLKVGEGSLRDFTVTLYETGQAMESGGVLSGFLGWGLRALFSAYGAVPLLLFLLLALWVLGFSIHPRLLAARMRERSARRREEAAARPAPPQPEYRPASRGSRHAIDISLEDKPKESPAPDPAGFFRAEPGVKTPAELLEGRKKERKPKSAPAVSPQVEPLSMEEAARMAGVELKPGKPEALHTESFTTAELQGKPGKKAMDPKELQKATEDVTKAVAQKDAQAAAPAVYRYPPVELLERGPGSNVDGREELAINSERLQRTLESFGVGATLTDITRGPTVTRYDLELDTGVRLSKLTNLAGDIALSLGVSGVRIAPIEGRSSMVGIEVPNKIVSTVYLRDIIDSENFRRAGSRLSFALGKDIGGEAIVGNIAKLPHLLIAGTTGSGKSVCMNCLILSLLYKSTPEEVRLIMIDPKMVELGIYNGVPHLYVPVVTDPKKAAGSLQWSVVEMLKRYRLFSELGVRDLAGYNALQKKNGEPTLPQVVIIIDELADLMMVASKEVEESICRVAQMGRAAGMHLVIATQRPSADVITGLMKANIPSRIAFAVSSAMESRIILDQAGAEKLVGHGDMLYAPIGTGKPPRIQGAFVSDEEREDIVNFIKENGEAQYSQEIITSIEAAAAEKDKSSPKAESVEEQEEAVFDELLPQAVEVIFETKQASVSMLQRRLKLGYSRAARIVDQMEEIGVVGPFEGSKPRQILMTREQWLESQKLQGEVQPGGGFADYQDAPQEEWKDG